MNQKPEIVVIGAGIVDVLVSHVDARVFQTGSTPAAGIAMQTGGDALNEAVVLSKLGRTVGLVSRLGQDSAGGLVLQTCNDNGVDSRWIARDPDLDTGINVVLIAPDGERRFITNPEGSLRKITSEDVFAAVRHPDFAEARVASFASIFVYPMLMPALEDIFSAIKAKGLILCADMTRPKHGEKVEDIRKALQYVDYIFPNYEEAAQVTGCTQPKDIASRFLDCGVKHVAIKLGKHGCLIRDAQTCKIVSAVPGIQAVDTTGAGDNFAAGFISALCENMDFEACARRANATASVCVQRIGATSGTRDLQEIMRRAVELTSMDL